MNFSNRFIRANNRLCDFDAFEAAPYFRKSFSLDFVPESAEITICGLGFYELSINGTPITKGALAPYISNPDDILYYDHYDLLPYLKKGKNVIGILLGNGFRNCYGGYVWGFDRAPCRGPVCVALALEATGDGKTLFLEADESFLTHPSPILYNDLREGYCYDSTKAIDGWDTVNFDDRTWKPAEAQASPKGAPRLCCADPIRATGELAPVEITHHDSLCYFHKKYDPSTPEEYTRRSNVYVYDFGENLAGVTRLCIDGKPGQRITVRHGETLVNGVFSMNNILCYSKDEELNRHAYDHHQTDVFICRGGKEEFLPRFKYDGFRYALVEGLESEQADENLLTAVVMHSDVPIRAGFHCSDAVLNRLQEMILRSDLSNLYYFPTDCPHREKNGWTGDAAVSAEQMLLNLGAEKTLAEWLCNIRAAQNEQGALPGIVPTGGWGFHWGNGPAWDNVCVELPLRIYQFTGNRDIIRENADTMLKYLNYIYTRRDERGLIAVGLGDWVDPYQRENGGKIASPLEVTDTLTVYNMLNNAAFLLEEIERVQDAEHLRTMAQTLRADFRRELIGKDLTVAGRCQTSQVFALSSGMFEEDERSAAEEILLQLIKEKNGANACGMIGLRHLFHVLTKMGKSDLAWRMITSEQRTCYGYWVAHGATTPWERFQEIGDPRQTSLNHHFLGDISAWFIRELTGLSYNPRFNDTSYFEVIPHPVLEGGTPYAEAHFDSCHGRIGIRWEKNGKQLSLRVQIPQGTHATLRTVDGWRLSDGSTEQYLPKESYDRTLTFSLNQA